MSSRRDFLKTVSGLAMGLGMTTAGFDNAMVGVRPRWNNPVDGDIVKTRVTFTSLHLAVTDKDIEDALRRNKHEAWERADRLGWKSWTTEVRRVTTHDEDGESFEVTLQKT